MALSCLVAALPRPFESAKRLTYVRTYVKSKEIFFSKARRVAARPQHIGPGMLARRGTARQGTRAPLPLARSHAAPLRP